MKRNILKILASLALLAVLSGCVSPQPNNPGNYEPSPGIKKTVAQAQAVIDATAPFNPYAFPLREAVAGLGAVITAASVVVASIKNKRAQEQTQAADTLAETVAKAGLGTAALQVAGLNGTSPAVAQHLDNNLQFGVATPPASPSPSARPPG